MSELLANHTSLRIGGPAKNFVHATTEEELVNAVKAADAAGDEVLIIGGGSNVLVADAGFNGTVIRVETKGNTYHVDACSGGMITVAAGEDWDEFVAWILEKGFAGLETMSGIPGTVGGAPIQNIGAYGHEVSEVIARVRTWDRKEGAYKTFSNSECEFSYRSSVFKKNPGRYVIIDVTFQLRNGEMSLPIKYKELASYLGVELESRVLVSEVRKAVLALRAAKGMLLDAKDHDTWSAGSFFVNPVLSAEAAAKLPADAPRWVQEDGRVKTSAAWLMENAGFKKGQIHNGAGVSNKHVLALINNGSASAADIAELARKAKKMVQEKFGVELEPEVRFIGISL
ncbi:MAG: UDP-N-acetylmuramate dehydrogenase [Actinobacteria bacterium]|nr:UDP-N-acetylmuramate dehydrogenase [Actinomycetota bacterium]